MKMTVHLPGEEYDILAGHGMAARAGEVSRARLERYHLLLKKAQEAWRNRYD